MAQSQISEAWRGKVCAILEGRIDGSTPDSVEWTQSALQDWDNESIGAPIDDALEAILDVLQVAGALGRPMQLKYPPGEAWDFTTEYTTKYGTFTFYCKICLLSAGDKIRIVSMHMPTKGTLR